MFGLLLINGMQFSECFAIEPWNFELTYESPKLFSSNIELSSAVDLDHNGVKEIIVTDFGHFGGNYDKGYNLYVLEWATDQFKTKLKKHWGRDNPRIKSSIGSFGVGFQAYKTEQLKSWRVEGATLVEAIPPFFNINWDKGKYHVNDNQVWEITNYDWLVGSWVFPWMSPSCYPYFVDNRLPISKRPLREPRECLVGIRDFSGTGKPKILSVYEEEVVKDKEYKQTLRVRDFNPDFKIEWEMQTPKRFAIAVDSIDKLNLKSRSGLMLRSFRTVETFVFEQDKNSMQYRLRLLPDTRPTLPQRHTLPDLYLRTTQVKDLEEYWGYYDVLAPDSEFTWLLRKVEIGPGYASFKQVDVDFERHEPFIGVIDFNVLDIDGDGIDEIILVERTGRRESNGESITFKKAKEYVRILKWNGDTYQTMWVSPPFALGISFLVENVTNKATNQLIIFTPQRTMQVWARR
jgi:hypothetical protein